MSNVVTKDFLFFYSEFGYHLTDGPFIINKDLQRYIPGVVRKSHHNGYEVYIKLECADWKEEDDDRGFTRFGIIEVGINANKEPIFFNRSV